jgi:hypothetical protein
VRDMAIKKSHYCVAAAYLLIFVLFGVYMAHERKLDKALNNFNNASMPPPSGSTDSTITVPQAPAPAISTETGALPINSPSAPPAAQQNWKYAEFCPGGEGLGSRLVVDGRVVETRSADLRQVWYAPGWDAKMVDKTLDKIRQDGGSITDVVCFNHVQN